MTQDIVNNNQSISYTNLDFSSIYTEVLDLIKNLTYKWDPSISDESDPGVILAKLSALVADKCNYNIDKSILEAFPLSVTQDANAQQLYEQLGYYMNWYESAKAPVVLSWISRAGDDNSEISSYTIPKFTIITDDEESTNYTLVGIEGAEDLVVSDGILTTDSKELRMIAMEGTPARYSYLGKDTVITAQMVDKYTHRIYFDRPDVSQNGVFITNTNQNNYADWKRVNNIYEQSYNELRYKFGFDNHANSCYLEFPDNYSELIGDGIEITYLTIAETFNNMPAQSLSRFLYGVTPVEDPTVFLDATNVAIQNYAAASGHKDKEDINEAYKNYKKTVGTFNTLITLRDYLNYIKSQDLDLCSNAFVCDRTNDIQSTYKIVSKQHDLDSIIVKVEQIIDKTLVDSNFDYKFERTTDTTPIIAKPYYVINNDQLTEVADTTGHNPFVEGWYEFVSRVASKHDALTPFSLKFYLLNNSISLNSKQNFNETFDLITQDLDFDYLLSDSAHIQHTFEDILPLGENTYKETEDATFLENKAYYIKDNDNINYILYTDYEVGDSTSSLTTTYYEVDVEALLPHVVMFKNIYPLSMNILTYDSLNEKTQEVVQKNIINALYEGVNSAQLEFGESININYLAELVKNSDDRIKEVNFDSINYITKAVYYDAIDKQFKEIMLSETASNIYIDQRDLDSILAKLIEEDIICKSILSGVTHLLTPDDVFVFHLNQKFINYFEDIYSITSQAVIDIGGKDAITTYSSDTSSPYIRQSYVLKPNETISLCRPQLETIREFTSGIHYECFLYNDIQENQTYELQKNEYIIFYQAYYDDTSSISSGNAAPSGFSVYACTEGVIINPSFTVRSQTNYNSLTSFARGKVIPNFDVFVEDNWYETSTYAYNYVTEIYNNATIINNSITGTNSIKLQSIHSADIEISDNYKFFWVLKTPQYSKDKTLKTYTLFPTYDVSTERLAEKEKNSYTLKDGEWLYYVDSSFSNLAILGAGTTIYRQCGINDEYDDDNPIQSFSYVNTNEFTASGTDARFNEGILETITSQVAGVDTINPLLNGWYEEGSEPDTYVRTEDTIYNSSKDYFVLVMEDNSGLYKRIGESAPYEHSSTLQSSNVFSELNLEDYLCNINPRENGWYEVVTCMNSRVTDFYAISDGASYNNYLRYTSSLDDSILSRFIFTDANYQDIDISDIATYKSISITNSNASAFDYISQRLLVPTNGDNSYKRYYADSEGTTRITGITVIDNPSDGDYNHTGQPWYEESEPGVFTVTSDTTAQILDTPNSLSYPTTLTENYCFDEVYLDNWNAVNFLGNGYFYKTNSAESTYTWEPTRTTANELVTPTNLSYLLTIYSEAKQKYPTDNSSLINYIILNWKTSITYNHPFKMTDKLGWRTQVFRAPSGSEEATHLGLSAADYATYASQLSSYTIYPKYDRSSTTIDVVIPISASSVVSGATTVDLVEDDSYIEILDRTTQSDASLVSYLEYLLTTFNGKPMTTFGMELQIKLFKFKNMYRMSNKTYFVPNVYVAKTFARIPAWTCEALDNDEIANDPIKVISDKWQSIQDNTSIRVVQNEVWSFSEGDTLRFEAPVISQNSVVWPRFSNTEIILDLDSYSISYQRNGSSIEDISKLTLDQYDWRGYSHLLLNTSSKDGQKLETNHSIILYTYNNGQLEEITTINGSDFENTTFQLKNPVSNVAGRYIDVTSEDLYGEFVPNSVYEFIPLSSTSDYYKYTSENNTYVYFNVDTDSKRIIENQVQIPLLLPKGHYLIPVHTSTEGIQYSVSAYIEAHKGSSIDYCINMSPCPSSDISKVIRITHNIGDDFKAYGEHLYGYDKDKYVGISNANWLISDNKYHYLDVNIQCNPESDDYIRIALPAYLTEYYSGVYDTDASPEWFGWYELVDGEYVESTETGKADALLEAVDGYDGADYEYIKSVNPLANGWYEQKGSDPNYYYVLSTDTTLDTTKTYYKDKDFYLPITAVEAPVLKIDAYNPLILIDDVQVSIVLGDTYKYENNDTFSDVTFVELKNKLRRLDDEGLYNYAFKPDSNEEVKDPLKPSSFFETNHPFNKFTIAQLDFDNLECRFTTRNISRR